MLGIPPLPDLSGHWAGRSPRQRLEVLRKVVEPMSARLPEFVRLITLEDGKARADAMGEATYAAEFSRWFAEEAVRAEPIAHAPSSGARAYVQIVENKRVDDAVRHPWSPISGARRTGVESLDERVGLYERWRACQDGGDGGCSGSPALQRPAWLLQLLQGDVAKMAQLWVEQKNANGDCSANRSRLSRPTPRPIASRARRSASNSSPTARTCCWCPPITTTARRRRFRPRRRE